MNANHQTVSVKCPFDDGQLIPIDAQLAPLIRLIWRVGIETLTCCRNQHAGLARIGFQDTDDVEDFLFIARRQYFVQASSIYEEAEDGTCACCQVFLDVYFPIEDIPRLVRAFDEAGHQGRSRRKR